MDATATDVPARRYPHILAGLSGCLLLVVAASPRYAGGELTFIGGPATGEIHGTRWLYVAAPVVATGVGLAVLRWWPCLLAARAGRSGTSSW